MKIKRLLIGMLACSAMVACTNDDELLVENGNDVAANYVAVKLMMTESSGGRAASDGGYNEGETYEQNIDINKSTFLFYDVNGNFVTAGKLVTGLGEGDDQNHDHTTTVDNSKATQKFIALNSSEDQVKNITQVLTVVNYHDISYLKEKPLSEVLKVVVNDAANENPANAGNTNAATYLMSTSVYHDGTNWVYTTKIGSENIKPTQSEAYDSAIKIYIERVAAKVQLVSGNTDETWIFDVTSEAVEDKNETPDIVVDETLTPVQVKILGWTINNYNTTSNLVKKYQDTWLAEATQPFAGWNNPSDHRSYWAYDTKYGYEGTVVTTTESEGKTTTTVTEPTSHLLEVKSFKEAMANSSFAANYCYEHAKAMGEDNVNEARTAPIQYPNVTTALIAAQILLPDGDDSNTDPDVATLYKHNGIYYQKAYFIDVIKGYLRKYTDATGNPLTDWTITIPEYTEGTAFDLSITVESGATDIKLNGTAVELEDVQDDINRYYVENLQVFTNGYCYYQIPIEHLTSAANAPLYGVIRNHWYQLKIKAVAHVGEPVADPGQDIPSIPEKNTAYYLAAELHVLNWHVVEQDVTLE